MKKYNKKYMEFINRCREDCELKEKNKLLLGNVKKEQLGKERLLKK